MKTLFSVWLVLVGFVPLVLIAQNDARANAGFGVLVMAHGGSDEWNQGVLDTVAPLHEDYTIEVAFGMADAVSIQEAVTRLERRGAKRIGVVRLFISGESWYERTAQIVGLEDGAPERVVEHAHPDAGHDDHGAPEMGHSMAFWRIESASQFALSEQGLAQAPQMAEVLLSRAQALSENPRHEDVLILAHGPESDAEDQRWLTQIEARTAALRQQHSFRSVRVATLREDWERKRVGAEEDVREFVSGASDSGGTALVIPFRVHGFGPYAKVLEGLEYRADEQGLIPHPGVTEWIAQQASLLEAQLHANP